MFKRYFDLKAFYFSPTYDLTNPFSVLAGRDMKMSNYDDRFCYNSVYFRRLAEIGANNWVHPFICGLIEHKLLTINQKALSFTLISRRDKNRAGMRFISRGSDSVGNVSNFVETEQLVCFINADSYDVCTYLQTRGSIPFLWKQTPNLKWNPTLSMEVNQLKNKKVSENHFNQIKKIYSDNHMLNLVDRMGSKSQKKMGEYMTELHRNMNDHSLKYTWFDFHHECRNNQYHNISKLIAEVKESVEKYGYGQYRVFKATEEGTSHLLSSQQEQKGVFRTNCMDCLDRTNVVQSVLARNILLSQLYKLNVNQKPNGDPFEALPKELEETFREIWTNNADRLSLLYSGTGALKTDFTRTGKRSYMGALEDGKRAVTRYFINNFYDTYNQNALDLLLGKVKASDIHTIGAQSHSATSVIATSAALLFGPYYLSALFLKMFGKTFNWSYFIVLMLLSLYMTFSYSTVASKRIWDTQILKDH